MNYGNKRNDFFSAVTRAAAIATPLRLSINLRTAKMQKSKPVQTKNPMNKKNFTQPFFTAV